MARNEAQPPQQTQARTRYDEEQPTHLIARSRGARPFRRAGMRFESSFSATPLADLRPEQVKRILDEPAIEARLATEEEARRFAQVADVEVDEGVSRAELVQYIQRQHAQLAEMTKRIAALEASRGDKPPKSVADMPPAGT